MARPRNHPPGTQILDLDAFDAPSLIIKHGGKEHALKQISVQDFVANTLSMQKLEDVKAQMVKEGKSEIEAEMLSVAGMLNRSFPTLSVEDFMEMDLVKLYKVFDFANQLNGSQAKPEGGAPANPPTPAGDAQPASSEA